LSLFVTTTSTGPAECAAVAAVMVVVLTTLTCVAANPPISTPAPGRKFVPEMVTLVPPLVDPELGEIPLTVGAGLDCPVYENPFPSVAVRPSGLATTTLTDPAACPGVVALI